MLCRAITPATRLATGSLGGDKKKTPTALTLPGFAHTVLLRSGVYLRCDELFSTAASFCWKSRLDALSIRYF